MHLCTCTHLKSVCLWKKIIRTRANSIFISMAADNHLIQLAEPGLQGPDRNHWPTYDNSISTIKHTRLSSPQIVAYQVYRSLYCMAAKRLLWYWLTAPLWEGGLKRVQSIHLLSQQAAINLDIALSSLLSHREIYYNGHASSPFLSIFSHLLLFSHLCLFLSPLPFPALFPPCISPFNSWIFVPSHL